MCSGVHVKTYLTHPVREEIKEMDLFNIIACDGTQALFLGGREMVWRDWWGVDRARSWEDLMKLTFKLQTSLDFWVSREDDQSPDRKADRSLTLATYYLAEIGLQEPILRPSVLVSLVSTVLFLKLWELVIPLVLPTPQKRAKH